MFIAVLTVSLMACDAPPVDDDAGVTDAGPEPLGLCGGGCIPDDNGAVRFVTDWQPSVSGERTCCECHDEALSYWQAGEIDCAGTPFVVDEACPNCPTPGT